MGAPGSGAPSGTARAPDRHLSGVLKKPIEVPTRATADFIASRVLRGTAILEVGCGKGHVARELLDRGYRVNAVDANPQAVAEARARDVAAMHASWPELECDPVDAVAFTRSLHHIGSLRPALQKAHELLRPSGALLVEDFAFDEADGPTLSWFVGLLRSPRGSALITPVPDEFVTEILSAKDPAAYWRRRHEHHEVHTAAAMARAIDEHFTDRQTLSVPYLYRYLVPVLPESPDGAVFAEEVMHEEGRRGERGDIVLVGRRTVAVPRGRQGPTGNGR